jgi:hypothetical protein
MKLVRQRQEEFQLLIVKILIHHLNEDIFLLQFF